MQTIKNLWVSRREWEDKNPKWFEANLWITNLKVKVKWCAPYDLFEATTWNIEDLVIKHIKLK